MKYDLQIAERPGPERPGSTAGDRAALPPFGHAVGFLLSQLGYVVARTFRAVMAELELEPRHFALMRAIDAHEGQSQNALVELLHIPASSMVSLIDQLELRGLVERRVHPSDRRSRTLHVTGPGRVLLDRAIGMAGALERRICTGLTDEERERLIGWLQLVGRNLDLVEGVHPAAMHHDDGDGDWGGARPSH